jgi:hypothetical protein
MWHPIRSAPTGANLQLATFDRARSLIVPFPCRHFEDGWLRADAEQQIEMTPTHWREWPKEQPIWESVIGAVN